MRTMRQFNLARHATVLCVLAGLAGLMCPPSGAMAAVPLIPVSLTLYAGQALVREAPGTLRRVAVGDGKLLNVRVIGGREMVLIADHPGDTSVHLWLASGRQQNIAVHIVIGDAGQVAGMVRRLLGPGSPIEVNAVGGNIVLSGRGLSPQDEARVSAIKKLYPQVLDFTSENAVEMQPVVLMRVRIMEFNKTALNQLGINWDSAVAGPGAGYAQDWTTNPFYRLTPGGFSGVDASGSPATLPLDVASPAAYFGIATSIGSQVELLEQDGKAWELAAPQLAARSGGVADFLVGGQVPIPITSGVLGETQVEYKDYGIKLHIAPVVGAGGEIATDIGVEVSKINPAVTVDGYPGFLTRKVSTQMNVRQGQTIVISGLLQEQGAKALQGIPGLADLPILGALFRSRDFQAKRTELVVFMTPILIRPDSPANRQLIGRSRKLLKDFRRTFGAHIVN